MRIIESKCKSAFFRNSARALARARDSLRELERRDRIASRYSFIRFFFLPILHDVQSCAFIKLINRTIRSRNVSLIACVAKVLAPLVNELISTRRNGNSVGFKSLRNSKAPNGIKIPMYASCNELKRVTNTPELYSAARFSKCDSAIETRRRCDRDTAESPRRIQRRSDNFFARVFTPQISYFGKATKSRRTTKVSGDRGHSRTDNSVIRRRTLCLVLCR